MRIWPTTLSLILFTLVSCGTVVGNGDKVRNDSNDQNKNGNAQNQNEDPNTEGGTYMPDMADNVVPPTLNTTLFKPLFANCGSPFATVAAGNSKYEVFTPQGTKYEAAMTISADGNTATFAYMDTTWLQYASGNDSSLVYQSTTKDWGTFTCSAVQETADVVLSSGTFTERKLVLSETNGKQWQLKWYLDAQDETVLVKLFEKVDDEYLYLIKIGHFALE